MLKYNIRGENIEVTPALRSYVEEKVGRLDKYIEGQNVEGHVTLQVVRDEHTVEVTIPLKGVILRAEETDKDMYASIDGVVDKLERQIRKHKTKINRKFRQDGTIKNIFTETNGNGRAEEEDNIEIVRTKRFNLKPMDVEEAVLQMEMLGHNFFVFNNAESDSVDIVYKRKDGRYGLIETV
ncbi:ribosome hibernation-promoting factor, HPF/YfiA family [Rubeoparvulum massiliense]|uniref:ribosome hibernation-promoting factor, HPF/YfiA family n=1 Tax=Rubeoparvulum massiliense TaxID=1631346 RepID=UPI00065DC5C0|nr:ribosome-associated translation inhibitor RaiA [Rubeoparvulum massiliense]